MARKYSVVEARKSLSSILTQVAEGESVELTRRGHPVAVVVSVSQYKRLCERPKPTFGEAYRRFREHHPQGVGLDQAYFDSLRDRSPGREVEI